MKQKTKKTQKPPGSLAKKTTKKSRAAGWCSGWSRPASESIGAVRGNVDAGQARRGQARERYRGRGNASSSSSYRVSKSNCSCSQLNKEKQTKKRESKLNPASRQATTWPGQEVRRRHGRSGAGFTEMKGQQNRDNAAHNTKRKGTRHGRADSAAGRGRAPGRCSILASSHAGRVPGVALTWPFPSHRGPARVLPLCCHQPPRGPEGSSSCPREAALALPLQPCSAHWFLRS